MCKDIYYANKRNVFIFDKEAQEESEKRGELILKCNWLDPNNKWHYERSQATDGGILVSLDQLSFDEVNKKLFYHDGDADFFAIHPEYLEKRKQLEISREEIVEALMKKENEENDEFYGQNQERRNQAIRQMIRTGGQVEVFKKNGKYGMSFEDTIIVPAKYTSISEYDDRGYATIKYNRTIGLVDRIGNIIVPCEASDIIFLKDNYIIYRKSTIKWYLAGINEAVAPYYKDNLSVGRLDDNIEVIHISNSSSRHEDHHIYIIDGKIALFKDCSIEEGKWGARYLNGNIALPFVYDKVLCKNGRIAVEGKEKYGILDYWMNEIIPPVYSLISFDWSSDNDAIYTTRKGPFVGKVLWDGSVLFDKKNKKIEYTRDKYILKKETLYMIIKIMPLKR